MSALTNDQIRLAILELLHEAAEKEPRGIGLSNHDLAMRLQIPLNKVDLKNRYLQEKRLIHFHAVTSDGNWESISANGMDVVEHKKNYASQYPFVNVTIQQVNGNNYGAMAQTVNSTVTNFSQQVTDSFSRAKGQVEARTELSSEAKQEVLEHLKQLEVEVGKEIKTLELLNALGIGFKRMQIGLFRDHSPNYFGSSQKGFSYLIK